MGLLRRLREETEPKLPEAPGKISEKGKKVVAAPYHKRIYFTLGKKDRQAIVQQAYESIRKSVMGGSEAVSEEFEFTTTEPLELSADQCSAHFDGLGEDQGFMDINWELLGEVMPKGLKLTVQGEYAYGADEELMNAIKEHEKYEDFNEETTGVYELSLTVGGDAVMQAFYEGEKGKQLFMDYFKEEGIKVDPKDLAIEWGTNDYHDYKVED